MKAFLLVTVLACSCCSAPLAQGQLDAPARQTATVQEQPTEQFEQGDYVVMTGLDYQRMVQVVRLMTHAIEQQNAEIARLAEKLKETCP